MKLSLHYPMDIDQPEFGTSRAVRAVALAAEKAGVDAINTTDHPAASQKWRLNGGHDSFDPFSMLSFVAGCTTRIKLHTHILVLPYRNPFITAKCAATTDVLSDGRLIIGIGSGYMSSEYSALGVDFDSRGAAMDEAIEVMRMAWSGEEVRHQGRTFAAFGTSPHPLPAQPRIPIWGGGNSKKAIERAARLCDGYCPFFAPQTLAKSARTQVMETFEDFKRQVDYLKECLERNGRSGPYDILGVAPTSRFYECDKASAQNFVDIAGELGEMGCTWMILSLPHPSVEGLIDNIQWAAEEVMTHLGQGVAA